MDAMTSYEQLARRYCALIGEDADDRIEGIPVWRIAMADLKAAMNALDTFGLDVRTTLPGSALAWRCASRAMLNERRKQAATRSSFASL